MGRVMRILALSSVLALAVLVAHSLRSLPRARAVAFWGAAVLYGIVRGIGVRFVTERLLDARAPYVMQESPLTLAGVPVQEIVGWALVAYLGWWLGWRFSRSLEGAATAAARPSERPSGPPSRRPRARGRPRSEAAPVRPTRFDSGSTGDGSACLFPQVLWACLFLGAIGWTVETAAGAAGWWQWSLPGSPLLLGVPAIGIIDWGFVGIDLLLPFLVITSPAFAGRGLRWLTLGAFPLHFLAHASVGHASGPWRTLPLFLAHAGLFGLVLWQGLGSRARDVSFDAAGTAGRTRSPIARAWRWLPAVSLALVLGVPASLETFAFGRPTLLLSLVPGALVAAASFAPAIALAAGIAAAGLSVLSPPLVFAGIPAGAMALVRWTGPGRRARRAVAVLVLAALAGGVYVEGVRREGDLRARLTTALEARDRGDLDGAADELRRIAGDFPSSHAPRIFLGEIAYRRGDLDEARRAFEAAVAIKPAATTARRYLAALALREGDPVAAATQCARGLMSAPDDPDLRHLASLARERSPSINGGIGPPIAR